MKQSYQSSSCLLNCEHDSVLRGQRLTIQIVIFRDTSRLIALRSGGWWNSCWCLESAWWIIIIIDVAQGVYWWLEEDRLDSILNHIKSVSAANYNVCLKLCFMEWANNQNTPWVHIKQRNLGLSFRPIYQHVMIIHPNISLRSSVIVSHIMQSKCTIINMTNSTHWYLCNVNE